MKLKFDPNLEYQQDAIQAVVDVFKGQPNDYSLSVWGANNPGGFSVEETAWANSSWTDKNRNKVLENVQGIQKQNKIAKDHRTEEMENIDFSIEMETGTGKTYVYLRTIHELFQEYGFSKFIIVVPSVAIREGVKKNLKITAEHFANLYDNPPVDWFVYDSGELSKVRNFATSNSLQIMVTTIQSFSRDGVVMHQYRDTMMGQKPVEFIRRTRPIMILDEPQNMESDNRREAIRNMNPLCTLRYSATHRKMHNLLYSLNPVDAYNLGLVKTIEVSSVREEQAFDDTYIKVKDITPLATKIRATLEIEVATNEGLKKQTVMVDTSGRNDLYEFSGERAPYEGYVISEINAENGYVEFDNGKRVTLSETIGEVAEQIQRAQIEETVREHFEKELRMRDEGVKTLSLFFIDAVVNYRDYERADTKGKFARWFEEIYEEYRADEKYKHLDMPPANEVHGGYFAKDNEGHAKDITERAFRQIEDATDLIMKDKEKLLSESEPLRFLFSHSALREGWDNPNIFQICTLNDTGSTLKKRQEIGRGLRLPVNQDGERIHDSNINILTVVANESYDLFARALQNEMSEDGVEFDKSNIKNKRKRKTVKPKKGFKDDGAFKDLWQHINQKTQYQVELDSKKLIEEAGKEIAQTVSVSDGYISIEKVSVEVGEDGVETRFKRGQQKEIERQDGARVPDALTYLAERTRLTRRTVFEILKASETIEGLMINPQQYLDQVLDVIKAVMQKQMVDGIRYERLGDAVYEMTAFDTHEWEAYLDKAWEVENQDKTLYDYIVWDSEVEEQFAKDLDSMESVRFYLKLPNWFKIDTPLGTYNPDWAVSFDGDKKLYFVADSKGSTIVADLRPVEAMKLACGKAHFNQIEDVEFKTVEKAGDLIK
jgi:type III restriction enzyme